MNRFALQSLRRKALYALGGILGVLLLVFGIYTLLNPEAIELCFLAENQEPSALAAKRKRLEAARTEYARNCAAFEALYQAGRSFIILEADTAVDTIGIKLENDIRTLAALSKIELDALRQCRISKINDTADYAEITLTFSAYYPNLIYFLAEVEMARPHFVWSNINLTNQEKTAKVTLNGTLRTVVLRDPALIAELARYPVPDHPLFDAFVPNKKKQEAASEKDAEAQIVLPKVDDGDTLARNMIDLLMTETGEEEGPAEVPETEDAGDAKSKPDAPLPDAPPEEPES